MKTIKVDKYALWDNFHIGARKQGDIWDHFIILWGTTKLHTSIGIKIFANWEEFQEEYAWPYKSMRVTWWKMINIYTNRSGMDNTNLRIMDLAFPLAWWTRAPTYGTRIVITHRVRETRKKWYYYACLPLPSFPVSANETGNQRIANLIPNYHAIDRGAMS